MNAISTIAVWFFIIFFGFSAFSQCFTSRGGSSRGGDVTIIQSYASDHLDLQAVGTLVQRATSARDLEERLNATGNAVNNLDLNEDDRIDYINVNEFRGGSQRGFTLSTEVAPGEVQELATIRIEERDGRAYSEIHGNRSIYGGNRYYSSSFDLTDALLIAWLFSDRGTPYASPYGWGRYPDRYTPSTPVDRQTYRNRSTGPRLGSPYTASSTGSLTSTGTEVNTGRNATSVRAPLREPTQAQRSFQSRNPSRQVAAEALAVRVEPSAPPPLRAQAVSPAEAANNFLSEACHV